MNKINPNMLRQITERFGKNYTLTNSTEIKYNCPFCIKKRGKADNDKKLYVDAKTGLFYCFKCHSKGRITYQFDYTSCSDVYKKILKYFDKDVDKNEKDDIISDEEEDNTFYVPNIKIGKDTVAYKYCLDRGITDDLIEFYNIRLGVGDLFGRIVIPNNVYNTNWTDMYSARTYLEQVPKYLNPPMCDKSKIVFNIDKINEGSDIYVVEGVITAIMAGKDAVAVYGCHPSKTQIDLILSKKPKTIYCVLDNDTAGRQPNEELAKVFTEKTNGSTKVYIVYMPRGKDAADMGEKEFKNYVYNNRLHSYNNVYSKLLSHIKS